MNIKTGDIIVTSQSGFKSLGSLPIRFANLFKRGYQYRMWTHSAVYIGNGDIVEAQTSGISRKTFEQAYLSRPDFDFVVLRQRSLSEDEAKIFTEFCTKQAGRKYDLKALAYFVLCNVLPPTLRFILESRKLNRCLNTENSFFCSELVAKGLLEANQYCFDRPPHHVMPVDFYNEFGFIKVDERIKVKRVNKLKKVITQIGYTLIMILWTILLIIVAVVIWTFILWIWNAWVKHLKKIHNENDKNSEDENIKNLIV